MPPSSPCQPLDPRRREAIALTISEEIARDHVRNFGRNPAAARTAWGEEALICVLEEIFTVPERALVAAGRFDRVRGDRQCLRDAREPSLCALVETLTGQPVRAYMTETSPDDIAYEVFVLGPFLVLD